MIDVEPWMNEAVRRLRECFGFRLLFVGLQGSHRRGEAKEESDIDILTILDTVDVPDLAAYRQVLRSLPEGEKACGFTCGREELLAWPPLELEQFSRDTDAWYGDLSLLLPPFNRQDTIAGARSAVSGLHHYTAYLYVSGDEATRVDDLKGVYKSFFFAIQLVHYLRCGVYVKTKQELLSRLSGDEAELMRCSWDESHYLALKQREPDRLFKIMLDWTGRTMRELKQLSEKA